MISAKFTNIQVIQPISPHKDAPYYCSEQKIPFLPSNISIYSLYHVETSPNYLHCFLVNVIFLIAVVEWCAPHPCVCIGID